MFVSGGVGRDSEESSMARFVSWVGELRGGKV
jgi:hypothetical protein